MLKALALFILFFSLQAREINPSELRELMATTKVELPQIDMGFGLFMDVNKLCLSGPGQDYIEPIKIKTVKKGEVEIRPRKKVKGYIYGCVVWTLKNSKRQCLQWGKKPYQIETEFNFLAGHSENDQEWVTYKLPLCKEVE